MGKVAVTFRILPEGTEVDVADLATSVRSTLGDRVRDVAVRPIAFGLKALEAIVVVEDAEGEADRVEGTLRGIAGVGAVETLGVTLV